MEVYRGVEVKLNTYQLRLRRRRIVDNTAFRPKLY
jgi:hypothetical protein